MTKTELSYFGIQAEWGVTKHFGGLRATDRLAALTHLGPGQKILEIGCGTGVGSTHLAETYGVYVTGVDLSPKMVTWAQRRAERKRLTGATEFRTANAQDLPFDDNRFDVALCESVTAFVPNPARALAEYTRVVKPGGYVALNEGTWLDDAPPAALVDFVQRTMGGVRFRTRAEWQALLSGAGLGDINAEVERMNARRQRRDEMAGLDRRDWLDRLRAIGKLTRLLVTDRDFRRYTRNLVPSRQVMRDLFLYLGFGLYVGRKGPEVRD